MTTRGRAPRGSLPALRAASITLVAALTLVPASPAIAQLSALKSDLEVPSIKRQRLNAEELLGFDRWRRFEGARFDRELHDHDFTPRLADRPELQEDLEEIVTSSLLRLVHKRFQRQLQLIERRDALRARVRGLELEEWERGRERRGLDVSPQFNFHSRAAIGAKLGLDGWRSRFWSGAGLEVYTEVDGPDAGIKLSFRDGWRSTYLVYQTAHRKRGETIEFGFRLAY